MPKSCKDPLTVPVRMILSNFLHFWMHRTTSFCRNHASRDVVIGNPKNQSAALRQIVAWGGKKWLRILAIRQGRSLGGMAICSVRAAARDAGGRVLEWTIARFGFGLGGGGPPGAERSGLS